MNEKDLLQKIKEDAEKLTPSASLEPEAIEQMLRSQKKQEHAQDTASESDLPKKAKENTIPLTQGKKKRRYNAFLRYGSIAAVFVLAVTVLWRSPRIEKHSESSEAQPIPAETDKLVSSDSRSHNERQGADTSENTSDTASVYTEAFTYAESPEAIYNTLYERFYQSTSDGMFSSSSGAKNGASYVEESAEDAVPMQSGQGFVSSRDTGSATMQSADFSGTNLQEAGVDEGDIVKTDGTYIYILRQDLSVAILKPGGKASEVISTISLGDSGIASIREMYLDGDRLYVIISEYITSLENSTEVYYTSSNYQAKLLTYDISDRKTPTLIGTVTQDGSYETSRKNGSYIYLFTSYDPELKDTYDDSTIMPRINSQEAAASDVFLPESLNTRTYLVISSVDTASPSDILDSKILVSGASNYYVSEENIYIANEQYGGQTRTELTKFHYADGEIIGVAAGSVKGYLNNSFSMNEYEGNLRVVSTCQGDEFDAVRNSTSAPIGANWEEYNALYVLDDKLQQLGAIEGLAEGEIIQSARFFGETGYFVTFRQTDPLFSVDLSDPGNPQILGELKVSGFSSYLHFYGENLLLGIGYEAEEATGITTGLKLSMFDISDPTNVTEVNRLVLPGVTWCPAIEDYKAILVQPEKNLIGFYCDNRYLLFSYDQEKGFIRELTYDFYSDMLLGQAEYNTMRGLYVEDAFYLAGNTFLVSFDMKNSFEKTEVVAF